MGRARHSVAATFVSLGLLAFFAGCGSGERSFTAEEFVDAVNAEGAGIALGEVITTNPDGAAVHEITFTEAATGVSSPAIEEDAHGAGTLLVVADADAARDEFSRCDEAPSLTCFRAANAVLRFEEMDGADQARIVTALEAIQTSPESE